MERLVGEIFKEGEETYVRAHCHEGVMLRITKGEVLGDEFRGVSSVDTGDMRTPRKRRR